MTCRWYFLFADVCIVTYVVNLELLSVVVTVVVVVVIVVVVIVVVVARKMNYYIAQSFGELLP